MRIAFVMRSHHSLSAHPGEPEGAANDSRRDRASRSRARRAVGVMVNSITTAAASHQIGGRPHAGRRRPHQPGVGLQQRRQMAEPRRQVEKDGNRPEQWGARAGSALGPPAVGEQGEALEIEPGHQEPAEEIGQRHAEVAAAVAPDPGLGEGRPRRVHDHVPLRHHERRQQGKRDDVGARERSDPPIQEQIGDDPGRVTLYRSRAPLRSGG